MNIRKKNESIRIALHNPDFIGMVPYVLVQPTSCWSATYAAWGKKTESPVIELGGRLYKVVLEPVT